MTQLQRERSDVGPSRVKPSPARWLTGLLAAALATACGPAKNPALPRPPAAWGAHPAVGHLLDVELLGPQDAPVRLQGAAGRVTVLCIEGPLVGAKGALVQQPGVVRAGCEALAAWGQDRVTVVGIWTAGEPAAGGSYRSYRDPDGARLLAKLPLRAGTEYLVLDRQRRIAAVIEAGSEPQLQDVLDRLSN